MIDKDKQYYLLSKKHSPASGMALWWGENDCGYRIDLRLAGKYSGKQILENQRYYNNENTQPILCEEADALVEHQVNYNNFK